MSLPYVLSELGKLSNSLTNVIQQIETQLGNGTLTLDGLKSDIQAILNSAGQANGLAPLNGTATINKQYLPPIQELVKHGNEWHDKAYVTQTEIDTSVSAYAARRDNPNVVTKAQVGLSNVDNVKQEPYRNLGLNAKSATDLPNTYPVGISYMLADSTKGFPFTGVHNGVMTYNLSDGTTSTYQFAFNYENARVPRIRVRSATLGNTAWGDWAVMYTSAEPPTKADLGLGNVQNYPVATDAEAAAGVSNVTYMTPARTKTTVDAAVSSVSNTQVLGPGTNLVTAGKEGAELDLKVNGRTLVNILGTMGSGESVANWGISGTAPTISTTQKRSGTASFKFSTTDTSGVLVKDLAIPLDKSKYYMVTCWAYVESYTSGGATLNIREYNTSNVRYNVSVNTTKVGEWQQLLLKVPNNNTISTTEGFRIIAGVNTTGTMVVYYDELRLYEVSAAEYAAIGTTLATPEQIDAYFPYVDGKQHVQGVAITKQGKNLLLPLTQRGTNNGTVIDAYAFDHPALVAFGNGYMTYDVIPNTDYVFSAVPGATGQMGVYNDTATVALSDYANTPRAFNSGANTKVRIYFRNTVVGTVRFSDLQLEFGTVATPFAPAEPQTVVLPVTLGEVGGIKDSVSNAGTEWLYTERVRKNVVIDGSLTWAYNDSPGTGLRVVKTAMAGGSSAMPVRTVLYDGRVGGSHLPAGTNNRASATTDTFYIMVSNAEAGWTDTLTPSANAIKALMNGWEAVANNGTTYTSWTSILDGSVAPTNTEAWVAANKAPSWSAWCSLDYALGTAAIPVTISSAEGAISLHPGGNQVTVETGIIQREKIAPQLSTTYGRYYINEVGATVSAVDSPLKYKTNRILDVYAGGTKAKWISETNASNQNGTAIASILTADYDASKTYYATYIALDKYLMTPSVAEVNASWKSGLNGVVPELAQSVADLKSAMDYPVLYSPEMLGEPTVPTAPDGTRNKQAASTEFAAKVAESYANAKFIKEDHTQAISQGLSIINGGETGADVDFSINGRTLVNLLGNYGNFEVDSNNDGLGDGWIRQGGTLTLSTTGVAYGTKSQRITSTSSDTSITDRGMYRYVWLEASKYYVAIAHLTTDGTTIGMIRMEEGASGTNIDTSSSVNQTLFIKFSPVATKNFVFRVFNRAPVGSVGWIEIDGISIYEVDAATYARIGVDITASNIRTYLPYVDGKQHLQNIVISKQGLNLMPNAPESVSTVAKLDGPYAMTLVATAAGQSSFWDIPVKPGVTYTIRAELTGTVGIIARTLFKEDLSTNAAYATALTSTGTYTFTAFEGSAFVRVYFNSTAAGTSTLKNWMMVVGDATALPTTFVPSDIPQTVILPVTLGETSGVTDTVYNSGSEWLYVERIKKNVPLVGGLAWAFNTTFTGVKRLSLALSPAALSGFSSARVVRYDGLQFKNNETTASGNPNVSQISNNQLLLNLATADTGWVDALTPNTNAIKAFFNGWKATANNGTAYTTWASSIDGSAPATNTEAWVAENKAPGMTTWGTVDYVLASAEVPTAVSAAEGSITLHPGNNQISVNTGVIVREKVNPVFYVSGNYYVINNIATTQNLYLSMLKYRMADVVTLYEESTVFNRYIKRAHGNAYGTYQMEISPSNFDTTKDYYLTYIARDKPAFSGFVTDMTANWKTGITGTVTELVQAVAELRNGDDTKMYHNPHFTGEPTVPTAADGTRTKQAASTEFTGRAIDNFSASKLQRADNVQVLSQGTNIIDGGDTGGDLDLTVNGRTLVNLLGNYGSGESLSGWSLAGTTVPTISTTQKRSGTSSFKMATGATGGSYLFRDFNTSLQSTKQYVVAGWAFVESWSSVAAGPSITLYDVGTNTQKYQVLGDKAIIGSWQPLVLKVPTSNTLVGTGFRILIGHGSAGASVSYYSDIRLYEVTAAEYAAIGTTITGDAFDTAFPYVNGRQHVQGVAITKQGQNLLASKPPVLNARARMNGPYDMVLDATGGNDSSYFLIDVPANTTITLSLAHNGRVAIANAAGTVNLVGYSSSQLLTVNTGSNTTIGVHFSNYSAGTGTFTFKNWMLVIGDATALPSTFTPAEPQTAILPVTLSQIGDARDTVYKEGSDWMYNERIKKGVTLTGALPWTLGTSYTGYKYVTVQSSNFPGMYMDKTAANISTAPPLRVTKYNGEPVTHAVSFSSEGSDRFNYGTDVSKVDITVSSGDSGWGDSYSPSAAEIAAYFYGYRMNNGTFGTAYNGTGTKTWAVIGATNNTGAVTVVPTSQAPITALWSPYILDYTLSSAAAPSFIPNAEGDITLHPGKNQIAVETGIIQREKVTPSPYLTNYYINALSGDKLSLRPSRILQVYKGNNADSKWIQITRSTSEEPSYSVYGPAYAIIKSGDFDPTATYYVTYVVAQKHTRSANLSDVTTSWKSGINGVVAELTQAVADLRESIDYPVLYSPEILGEPTVPTAPDGTRNKQAASTEFAARVAENYTAATLDGVTNVQTLASGVSLITADKVGSDLDLIINGRTLVNILGTVGGGESLTGTIPAGVAPVISTTQKRSGLSSYKYVPTASSPSYFYKDYTVSLDKSKYYVLGAWFYTESTANTGMTEVSLRDAGSFTARYSIYGAQSVTGSWQWRFAKIPANNTLVGNGFRLLVGMGGGYAGVFYIDDIRLYEITAAEYNAIGTTIDGDAVDQYYPYVDGKKHTQGLAITKFGRNLLDGIPITLHANAKMNGLYDLTLTATATWSHSWLPTIPVVGGRKMTFSIDPLTVNGAYVYVFEYDSNGTQLSSVGAVANINFSSLTFTTNTQTVTIRVQLTNAIASGTFTFKNWKLEYGDKTPFEPAAPQNVIIPVTLGQIGDVTDTVYNAGSDWMYAERIKKDVVLDGSLTWGVYSTVTGFKNVQAAIPSLSGTGGADDAALAVRYDGIPLKNVDEAVASWTQPDYFRLYNGSVYMSIRSTDSGWTDALNPNVNAVKAFMNGWKAVGSNGTVYTSWVSILDASVPTTNTEAWVAANKAPGWTGWATLDYVMTSAPAPVPIRLSEGSISLHGGVNQIMVETGVIQREKAKPIYDNGFWNINAQVGSNNDSKLAYRTKRTLAIYKDANIDPSWIVGTRPSTSTLIPLFGNDGVQAPTAMYDPTATYYVTYLVLDQYAVTPSLTNISASWKTGLNGVVTSLAHDVAMLQADNDRQDFADKYLNDKVAVLQNLYPTTLTGDFAINANGKDLLQMVVAAGNGFKTLCANSTSTNIPSGVTFRGHSFGSVGSDGEWTGFVQLYSQLNTNFSNFRYGASGWGGWQKNINENMASGETRVNAISLGGYNVEKTKSYAIPNTLTNAKMDITWEPVLSSGTVEITVTCGFNTVNANGVIRKVISYGSNASGGINPYNSYYKEVLGPIKNYLGVSELVYDSTTANLKITVETLANGYVFGGTVTVKFLSSMGRAVPNITIGDPYSGASLGSVVPVQVIPDDTVTTSGYQIQKHPLTNNIGQNILLTANTDLNTVVTAGFYSGNGLTNAPTNEVTWWYVQVYVHSGSVGYVLQRAYHLSATGTPTEYIRRRVNNTWTTWVYVPNSSMLNVANGILQLDSSGLAPLAQLPAIQKWLLTSNTGSGKDGVATYDLNTLITTGYYSINTNSTNMPISGSSTMLLVMYFGSTYYQQEATVYATGPVVRKFVRETRNSGTTWTAWAEIETTAKKDVANGYAGLNASGVLLPSVMPATVTKRVNLYGQLQITSYRRSVVALCEVTNTEPGATSYTNGVLTFKRVNGLAGQTTIMVSAEKRWSSTAMNISVLKMGLTGAAIRPCTFTYNGVKYGGLEIYIEAAESQLVEFNGAGNFTPFGVDYYTVNTSTVVNAEINNSLGLVEGTDFYYINGIFMNDVSISPTTDSIANRPVLRDSNKKIAEVASTRSNGVNIALTATNTLTTAVSYTTSGVVANYVVYVTIWPSVATTLTIQLTYTSPMGGSQTTVILNAKQLAAGAESSLIPLYVTANAFSTMNLQYLSTTTNSTNPLRISYTIQEM
jgi:hypothetical protein